MNCHADNQQTDMAISNSLELQLRDLFDLDEIQRIQDAFSLATGVSALITDLAGNPITRPSQFTRFCQMIRSTDKGQVQCRESDTFIGLLNPAGPICGLCLSGKLLDGGTGITVGERQIANWLIGQVLDEPVDESYYRQYARELGLDETEFLQALAEVPRMSRQRFEQICQALHLIAAQLSRLALRNAEQQQVIEQYRQTQIALQESEERYRALVQKSSEAIVLIDPDTRMVVESNRHFQELIGYSQAELAEMPIYNFVLGSKEQIDRYYEEILPLQHELPVEARQFRHKSGRIVEVERSGALVHLRGKTVYMVTARDVTDRKYIEEKMNYLSYHDMLTGLHNRTYFEEEMLRRDRSGEVEIGLIIFDLDGLKLVNDSFGHEQGDDLLVRTAELIRGCFNESDLVARIGGDEIAVLMSRTSPEMIEAAMIRVYEAVESAQLNPQRIPISLSAGSAFRAEVNVSMRELFREADNKMYRGKLHRSQSTRSAIVQTVMKLLEARDFITEGHADRLQEMLIRLAKAAGLPESRMTDLRLLAQFHDIGKVGIPDRILLKPGPLEPEEVIEMRRHCEIGHRIAQSSPDLMPVADWVLKHQEWWNGEGYPLGLAGERIPIECRILSIADAYDAMTSDRPYRKAMSHEAALAELRRCAGVQFDPALVELFIATCPDTTEST
jgi:diguanylate cyclase (GGDEF)-like protein/PAS domain S-box-containing protein